MQAKYYKLIKAINRQFKEVLLATKPLIELVISFEDIKKEHPELTPHLDRVTKVVYDTLKRQTKAADEYTETVEDFLRSFEKE